MNIEKGKILFKKYWFPMFVFIVASYFSNLFSKIFSPLNDFIIEKSKGLWILLYTKVVVILNFRISIYSLIVGLVSAFFINWMVGLIVFRFRGLRIVDAKYGKNGKYIDITSKLNAEVRENKLKIPISNSIAGDPLVGTNKEAIVKYRINGKPEKVIVPEYQVLELP